MEKIELFYKLVTVKIINDHLTRSKEKLQEELYAMADDSVLLKRRFRMLGQLSQYETQIYKKIYHFRTNDLDDYVQATNSIIKEIHVVVDRNS